MTTKVTKLGGLKPNERNPRKTTDAKLKNLRRTAEEFGDISGIVFNRRTGQLVGGHQRAKALPADAVISKTEFSKPTKLGTVAEGYVVFKGERFRYREVDWDETKEKAANLAANKSVGEWDDKLLAEMMQEIDEFGFDLDLTGFDEMEREGIASALSEPNFPEGGAGDQGKLDEKKKTICPHCGEAFLVGGRI